MLSALRTHKPHTDTTVPPPTHTHYYSTYCQWAYMGSYNINTVIAFSCWLDRVRLLHNPRLNCLPVKWSKSKYTCSQAAKTLSVISHSKDKMWILSLEVFRDLIILHSSKGKKNVMGSITSVANLLMKF